MTAFVNGSIVDSKSLDPEFVKSVQGKLNRLMRSGILRGLPMIETGLVDIATKVALDNFVDSFGIHSAKFFPPWVCVAPKRSEVVAPPSLPPAFAKVRLISNPIVKPEWVPDLEPDSVAMQVLQWLVDNSEGPLSQMTEEAHLKVARVMLPGAKRATIEKNTPYLVRALLEAKQLYGHDMDSTAMFLVAVATIAAENGTFRTIDEGADYGFHDGKRVNNSAYEDFDVYEPYGKVFGKDLDAKRKAIQDARDRRMKKMGAGFREPVRLPGEASGDNRLAGDGARFKGRGWVQLTFRGNYEAAGNSLNLDLVNHPELVSDDVEVSARTLAWFLDQGGPNSPHTYRSIQAALVRNDTKALRRAVNGGLNGLSDFEAAYFAGKRLLHRGLALRYQRMGLKADRKQTFRR